MSFIQAIDSFLPRVLESIANPFWDSFMVFVSHLGDAGFVWIIVVLTLLISKKYRKVGIIAAVSLTVCFVTGNYLIKPLVGRIRPCNLYPDLRMIVPCLTDYSFPSMHTATAFSVSAVLFRHNKLMGIPAIILSVFIALSRVYLNLHFATDIVCGALYGIIFALFTDIVIKKTKLNYVNY